MRITGSVGRWEANAVNAVADVRVVQEALSVAARMLGRKDYDPGKADGQIAKPPRSSRTIDAIVAFQRAFIATPDGVISPHGQTLNRLRKYRGTDAALIRTKPPAPVGETAPAPVSATGPSLPGMCFPLAAPPKLDYHQSKHHKRWFGAGRSGRLHAACDLIAPEGTPVYAIADGVVTRGKTDFYHKTFAVEITHERGFVARYCEIAGVAPGTSLGARVKRGQVIAYVGKMHVDSMLHFELYAGTASGRLTIPNRAPFNRRQDLLDPTSYLDQARNNLPTV